MCEENKRLLSLKSYQDKGFYYINKYLREKISDEEFIEIYKITQEKINKIKEDIANIDLEFSNLIKTTKSDNLVVYRGVHNTINGNIIYSGKDNGFVSTSKSLNIAQKFAGKEGVIYEILIEKDVHYIDLSINNIYEEEVLLQRGLIYTIISQKKLKKNIYIKMKVSNS